MMQVVCLCDQASSCDQKFRSQKTNFLRLPVGGIKNQTPEPGQLVGDELLIVPRVDEHHLRLLILRTFLLLGSAPPAAGPVPPARPRQPCRRPKPAASSGAATATPAQRAPAP